MIAIFILVKKAHYNKDSDEEFYNSIIYMTAYFYKFNEREIDNKRLKELLKQAKISINNKFERDMSNSREDLLSFKSESFKITDSGIKLGLSTIKALIKD